MSGFIQYLAFAHAARHRSFARAARELGLASSTVAKRIVALEKQLGVRLFHRTTRQVTLTTDGEVLYARCEQLLADIDELENLAGGAAGEARGELRINAPITYGKRMVVPVLADLLREHPALSVDIRLSDQLCDPVRDGLDAAIRIMPLLDSRLASKRIGWQYLALCASPAYLAHHGRPRHPSQLSQHAFVVFRNPTSGRERPLQFEIDGKLEELHPRYRMLMDDGEGMVEAARHGCGLIQVPSYMVSAELASGALTELLPSFRPSPLPINVIWPGSRLMPPRLRALIDALAGKDA